MPITSSGQIKLEDDVVDEFGGSAPHAISEYYRGGSAGVGSGNTSVPTSGEIQLSDFYGAQAAIVHTISSNATNQDAQTLFGTSTFQGADAKILAIPSGVSIGGSGFGTQNVGLTIPSGMGGTLTIQNAGTISGAGGSGGSGGGGASPHPTTGSRAGSPGSAGSAGGHAIPVSYTHLTLPTSDLV